MYDYTDMLGFVAWLNVLVRKHQDLGLACLAQTVNVVSHQFESFVTVYGVIGVANTPDLSLDHQPGWLAETDDLLPVSHQCRHSSSWSLTQSRLKLFSKYMRDGHLLNLPSVAEH